jgi:hypothetical protein
MVDRRGVSAAGCLIYLLIIAGVVYFGSPFGSAYLDYYRYKDAMTQEAQFATQRSDLEIQARLKVFADSLGLPRSASLVRINRGASRVTILGNYNQTINVPILGPKKWRFMPKAEASF